MTALAAAERLIGVLEAENTALHQSDVAGIGAVEGRADLVDDLPAAGRAQRLQGGEAVGHGARDRGGARLQGDHDGVGLR